MKHFLTLATALFVGLGTAYAEEPIIVAHGPQVLPVTGLLVDLPPAPAGGHYAIYGTLSPSDPVHQQDTIALKDARGRHVMSWDVGVAPLTYTCAELAKRVRAFDPGFSHEVTIGGATLWMDVSNDAGSGFVPFGGKGPHAVSVGICAADADQRFTIDYARGVPSMAPDAITKLVASDAVIGALYKAFVTQTAGPSRPVGDKAVRQWLEYEAPSPRLQVGSLSIERPTDGAYWYVYPLPKSTGIMRLAPAFPAARMPVEEKPHTTCETAFAGDATSLRPDGWLATRPFTTLQGTYVYTLCREAPSGDAFIAIPQADHFGHADPAHLLDFAEPLLAELAKAIDQKKPPRDPNAPRPAPTDSVRQLPVARPRPAQRVDGVVPD